MLGLSPFGDLEDILGGPFLKTFDISGIVVQQDVVLSLEILDIERKR